MAGRRILIVEDDEDGGTSLRMLLATLGHDAHHVVTGEQAVAAARDLRPEVVIMDINLPSIDGYEAARRIRAASSGELKAIIALTGFGQARDIEKSQAEKIDHHLVKPCDLSVLTGILDRLPAAG